MAATWFEVTFTGDPTDEDREHAAELIREGYNSGQLSGLPDDDADDEALRRLEQAELRLVAQHPKAARDPQLASILGALRDNLENR